MTSHYTEGIDKAREFSLSAFETMVSQSIPATPKNFTIWYSYHAGSHSELIRSLDEMLNNGVEFTELRNEEIYANISGSNTKTRRSAIQATLSRRRLARCSRDWARPVGTPPNTAIG